MSGVQFGRFAGVMGSVLVMAVRRVCMVGSFFVGSCLMMGRGLPMMVRGVFMVLGGVAMMVGSFCGQGRSSASVTSGDLERRTRIEKILTHYREVK
jgi:hypothetical protein